MPFLRTKNYQTFEVVDEVTDTVVHQFEGAAFAAKALPGDDLELDASSNLVLKGRAVHPPLAGYLELNSKTTFGHTKSGLPLYLFVPMNPAYPSFIVGSKEKDRSQKRVAIVDFLEWTEHLPRGSLKQLLGAAGTLEAEEQALLWNACPYKNLKEGLAVLEDDCPSRTRLEGITFRDARTSMIVSQLHKIPRASSSLSPLPMLPAAWKRWGQSISWRQIRDKRCIATEWPFDRCCPRSIRRISVLLSLGS